MLCSDMLLNIKKLALEFFILFESSLFFSKSLAFCILVMVLQNILLAATTNVTHLQLLLSELSPFLGSFTIGTSFYSFGVMPNS